MRPKSSSVPSAQKIEKIILDHFQSVGFDPIDTFSYQVEKRFDLIELKLNEIIDRLNADQPGSHQGGEEGCQRCYTPHGAHLVVGGKCSCECHPSSPQDAKPVYIGNTYSAVNSIGVVESGQAGETMEQRFDKRWRYSDTEECICDYDHIRSDYGDTWAGEFDRDSLFKIKDFIKQELARQREGILTQLITIRDAELSDTPMMKSRAAYNINLLIDHLDQGDK